MRDLANRRGLDLTVYEPAEDSRLLAETVTDRLEAAETLLDVGTGTGYVGARVQETTDTRVVGVDLNPHACKRAHAKDLDVVRGDLMDPFGPDSFDVVVFNPPYLPTDPGSEPSDWLAVALSGGESGRTVIERFLGGLDRVLVSGGVAFLLVSTHAGVEKVATHADRHGFHAVTLAEVSFPGETLAVLKLTR
jgi:release factor glutamine methyltransferase